MASKYAPIVAAFGELMIEKLDANDHKPTWKEEALIDLQDALEREVNELGEAILCIETGEAISKDVAREAADVANFAMMIADKFGGLPVSDLRA